MAATLAVALPIWALTAPAACTAACGRGDHAELAFLHRAGTSTRVPALAPADSPEPTDPCCVPAAPDRSAGEIEICAADLPAAMQVATDAPAPSVPSGGRPAASITPPQQCAPRSVAIAALSNRSFPQSNPPLLT